MFQITVTHTPCLEQIAYFLFESRLTEIPSRERAIWLMESHAEDYGGFVLPPWITAPGYLESIQEGYEQALVWAKQLFPEAKSYQETNG